MIPTQVHQIMKKHTIGDGMDIVIDQQRSHGSWLVDAISGKKFLDCYSQFASQPIGWNHPYMHNQLNQFAKVVNCKIANSDLYSVEYAQFVNDFADIAKDFNNFFFIDGGTLAVENALKASFDWKAQKLGINTDDDIGFLDVIHLQEAFHGRSGYTLSLTNTDPTKTKWFPKFKWTRVVNPKIHGDRPVEELEKESLNQIRMAVMKNYVAAIIVETIQGEGGDNHFRPEYLKELRKIANECEAMLIFDEVQCGMGLTGKMWAYQYFDVVPDMICFGKKTQVCGFASTNRIHDVETNVFKTSSRINSTWGGNIVDAVRFSIYKTIIEAENLVNNAATIGNYFLEKLKSVEGIANVRGRGLMVAFDLENKEKRDNVLHCLCNDMLALKCGNKSIRLRPHLDFKKEEADIASGFIQKAVKNVK